MHKPFIRPGYPGRYRVVNLDDKVTVRALGKPNKQGKAKCFGPHVVLTLEAFQANFLPARTPKERLDCQLALLDTLATDPESETFADTIPGYILHADGRALRKVGFIDADAQVTDAGREALAALNPTEE